MCELAKAHEIEPEQGAAVCPPLVGGAVPAPAKEQN
jgi:hypothetical protein